MKHEPINLLLMRAMYWFRESLETGLAARDLPPLTRAEAFVIINIAMGEHRAMNIARNLGVTRQAISQVLSGLESRGYVKTAPDPNNGRARIASFSRAFERHSRACHELVDAAEGELARRLGPKLVAQMRLALESDWGEPPRVVDDARTQRSEKGRVSRTPPLA